MINSTEINMTVDSQLQQAVLAELNWEPSIDAGHIGVTAKDGVVTLSGHAESYAIKQAAEMAACRVKGVKGVVEEIEVQLPFETERTDAEIAAAAIARLAWNVLVPRDAIQVKVEKGWITLTGEVDWWYQKDDAEQDVRPLRGVIGISNQATIKSRVDTATLSADITHALHRTSFSDPSNVHVHADGGIVVLSGSVRTINERQVATQVAWGALGVTMVENDLIVV